MEKVSEKPIWFIGKDTQAKKTPGNSDELLREFLAAEQVDKALEVRVFFFVV